jgi:hypothetical protein
MGADRMIVVERDAAAVRDLLEPALAHDLSGWTWADVEQAHAAGALLLLNIGAGIAAAALQILPYRGGQALHVAALGGQYMDRWLPHLLALLADVAQNQGCSHVTLLGRRGWQRQLAPAGFHVEQVLMAAEPGAINGWIQQVA